MRSPRRRRRSARSRRRGGRRRAPGAGSRRRRWSRGSPAAHAGRHPDSTSPLNTIAVSWRSLGATLAIPPPVPSGSASVTYSICRPELGPVAELRLEHRRLVRRAQHHVLDAGLGDAGQQMGEEGQAGGRQHRLGRRQRQRAQPGALAADQDDGVDLCGVHWSSPRQRRPFACCAESCGPPDPRAQRARPSSSTAAAPATASGAGPRGKCRCSCGGPPSCGRGPGRSRGPCRAKSPPTARRRSASRPCRADRPGRRPPCT